jgi:hypothetical protein
MRKVLLAAAIVFVFSLPAISQQLPNGMKVVTGQLIRVTPALKDIKPEPGYSPRVTRDLTGLIRKKTWKADVTDYGTNATGDPVLQKDFFNPRTNGANSPDEGPLAGTKVIQNYEGMGFTNVAPADPCLTNGPNHVIQMINGSQGSYFRIWDKSGASVVAQTYMNVLFPVVSTNEYWGDPIVLYDQFSDRYIISEFAAFGNNGGYANTLLFAVSQTNNPAGSWYVYQFQDNSVFIDYPHYSVWPNAIYGTSNDFNTAGTAYLGSSIMAFDKAKMIAGNATANMIRFIPTFFTSGVSPTSKPRTLAPVSISGPTAPTSPNTGLFLYYHDDNSTASTTDVDTVGIINMTPDFATPANTTVSIGAQMVVAPFKSNVCASRACIPGGTNYDAISDRFMHRVSLRNFGTHEAIVANHTVDATYPATPAKAGIRWYEFRRNAGAWSVNQQGTYAPDTDGRWMGGIGINSKGQIALAFNHSGTGKFASIYFTGRNATDPPGVMVYDEGTIQVGTAYGTFQNRWGDYNDLETDVTNDSIFWFTAMYGATNWRTKVASFKLEALPALDARLFGIVTPANGLAQCSNTITPVITVRNAGTTALTGLKIYTQLDNGAVGAPYDWTGSLATSQSTNVTLPSFTAAGGAHTLKIWTALPNGGDDENKVNDTAQASFTILAPLPGPFVEGFESTTFPPAEWRVINSNAGSLTWQRNTAARKSGTASAFMDFYDYTTSGHEDILLSPILDVLSADSIILSFERAYRPYSTSASFADGLAIVVSTDCGATFTEIWRREGVNLSTVTGTQTSEFVPTAAQWLNQRIDLKPFIGNATSITVGFKAINRFGNNLYLDDINIRTFRLPFRDATVRAVGEPSSRLCTRTLVPQITLANQGRDTLKSVKILYRIGTGALDSIAWTGSLPNGSSTLVNFATYNKTINLASAGAFTFTVYTKQPNGLNDEEPLNDTARVNFTVFDAQPDPVKEGFEQATFPPANWSVQRSGAAYSWDRTTRAASERTASAWIRNYRFNSSGKGDDLYSPLVQITSPDSVYLKFDVAHSTSRFPGSTAVPLDTLEVLLTTDCGKTFRSVYKKWGEDLSTVDRNFPTTYPVTDTVGFVPTSKGQWRSEWVDVSKFVPANSKFQFVFRSTSNRGNNTFIDNVDISTITLPARLKQAGYMITPNPFEGSFVIRHLLAPANLRGIQVMNSAGQTVVARSFNGNASNYITIDLSRYANGAYQVKLVYDNKVITERIIKRK